MQREFNLEEVSFDEFNRLCNAADVRPESENQNREVFVKKYYRIFDRVEYENVEGLLSELDDGVQHLKFIWVPGEMRLGRARSLTQEEPERHRRDFIKREGQYKKLIVGFSKSSGARGRIDEDMFHFHFDGGWVMRRFFIKHTNFDCYNLSDGKGPVCKRMYPNLRGVLGVYAR